MNVRELIDALEKVDPEIVLADGFGEPDSWRGSYDEIAFKPAHNVTVGSMLANARKCIGLTCCGYKGGEYTYDETTPCNVAKWGEYGGDDDRLTTWRLRCMLATDTGERREKAKGE